MNTGRQALQKNTAQQEPLTNHDDMIKCLKYIFKKNLSNTVSNVQQQFLTYRASRSAVLVFIFSDYSVLLVGVSSFGSDVQF